jgi:hypothetical protein
MRHWGLTARRGRASPATVPPMALTVLHGCLTALVFSHICVPCQRAHASSMRPRRGAPALVPTLQPPGCVSPLHSARFRAASPSQLCQRFVPLPEAMVSRSWRSHALGETASPRCLSSLATRLLDRQRYDDTGFLRLISCRAHSPPWS